MKNNIQRINNVIGQLEGVKKMIEDDQDCLQVVTQLKAIKSAVSSVTVKILEENADNCINKAKIQDKRRIKKIINEISKIV